jgi:hypothetical protein
MSVRHLGLHVAVKPQESDRHFTVVVGRPQSSEHTWIQVEAHGSIDDALAQLNEIAYSVAGDYAPEWRSNAGDRTLVDWERALADHPNNPQGKSAVDRLLDNRLGDACDRFLALYGRYGGWRYYGRPDATDPSGYAGPVFWQEDDVRFRLAYELEREFPAGVHLNSLLSPATVADWDAEQDGKNQHVDVLVDDLRDFLPGPDSLRRFAERTADAFVEVRFLRRRRQTRDLMRDLQGVFDDADSLGRHLQRGRTARALMLVVDDDGRFLEARNTMPWPRGVELVHAGPGSEASGPSLPFPWSLADAREHDVRLDWGPA